MKRVDKLEHQEQKARIRESNRGNRELGTKKYPCCPNCKEPFELSEIEHTWKAGIFIQKRLDDRLYQLKNDD